MYKQQFVAVVQKKTDYKGKQSQQLKQWSTKQLWQQSIYIYIEKNTQIGVSVTEVVAVQMSKVISPPRK